MLIFRVEHKETKHGSYCYQNKVDCILEEWPDLHAMEDSHPSSYQEGLASGKQHGFSGILKLYSWFADEPDKEIRQWLIDHNYHIVVYFCDEVYVQQGKTQLAFDITKASVLMSMEIEIGGN